MLIGRLMLLLMVMMVLLHPDGAIDAVADDKDDTIMLIALWLLRLEVAMIVLAIGDGANHTSTMMIMRSDVPYDVMATIAILSIATTSADLANIYPLLLTMFFALA